jgi:hypothetical protein
MEIAETADDQQNKGGRQVGTLNRYRTFAAAITCGATMILLGAGVGDAASPPAVTEGATAVTSNSAVLNGTISPGGLPTDWGFQWGTTTAYGQNTAPAGPLTDFGTDPEAAGLQGLQPGTTYHFRMVAVQGAAGTSGNPTVSGGDDMTFTTAGTSPGSPGSNGSNGSNGSTHQHAHASLRSRTISVHHGAALIRWRCSGTSGAACKGRISLSARGKIGASVKTVRCGSATFEAPAGGHRTVRADLGNNCLSLVMAARHHRLAASLKAHFSQGTGNLKKTRVTLVG